MLRSRSSRCVTLGLTSSTAEYPVSPAAANTTGTRCGRPSAPTVASRATRAAANRLRAAAASTALRRAKALGGGPRVVGGPLDLRPLGRRHHEQHPVDARLRELLDDPGVDRHAERGDGDPPAPGLLAAAAQLGDPLPEPVARRIARVREPAVAVAQHPVDDLLPQAADPQRRMRLLHRL